MRNKQKTKKQSKKENKTKQIMRKSTKEFMNEEEKKICIWIYHPSIHL